MIQNHVIHRENALLAMDLTSLRLIQAFEQTAHVAAQRPRGGTNSRVGRTESHFASPSQFATRPVSARYPQSPNAVQLCLRLLRRSERDPPAIWHGHCTPPVQVLAGEAYRYGQERAASPLGAQRQTLAPGVRIRRETLQATAIADAALRVWSRCCVEARRIHAISTGGQNVQELEESSPRFGESLRRLRRKVWAYPLLLLANGALLGEVRRPVQGAQGGRP